MRRLYHFLLEKKRKRYIAELQRNGLSLGKDVEIVGSFFFDPSHCYLISIGKGCTICPNVRLIAHDASTKKILGYTKLGRIDIGDNCFIGDSAIVLPGVTIGADCIVGAGSGVANNLPPGTGSVGSPARVIDSVERYTQRMRTFSQGKRVFDEQYFIDELDDRKRKEMIQSIGDNIGFIV
jgi:maltose O-acetyltransferase